MCVCVCVRVCMRACVHACECVCVCVCVCTILYHTSTHLCRSPSYMYSDIKRDMVLGTQDSPCSGFMREMLVRV